MDRPTSRGRKDCALIVLKRFADHNVCTALKIKNVKLVEGFNICEI
jgi:hypothetical protein